MGSDPIRVMLVDDSAVVRGLLGKIIESDPRLTVVSSVGDGIAALRMITSKPADVILLDIEMPRMGGLEALPKLLEKQPSAQVIMVSTLTTRNAEITFKAMQLGAMETIAKPTASMDIFRSGGFKEELINKVVALGEAAHRPARRATSLKKPAPSPTKPREGALARLSAGQARAALSDASKGKFELRPAGRIMPQILAIGSSTGGPKALFTLMKGLGPDWRLPTVITQHMPPKFTKILAEHIAETSKRPCVEVQGGEVIEPGHTYIAQGGFHMVLERAGGKIIARCSDTDPENFCKPAVDPMMRSVVSVYGSKVLAVILTGMGHDGADGCEGVVKAGGTVFGQDEETSVVWGMPAAVAERGLCTEVLPIERIAPRIKAFVLGRTG